MTHTPELEAMSRAFEPSVWAAIDAGRLAPEQEPRAREDALNRARRALLALQEPSEGMVEAGQEVMDEFWPSHASPNKIFTAMIDHILGDAA